MSSNIEKELLAAQRRREAKNYFGVAHGTESFDVELKQHDEKIESLKKCIEDTSTRISSGEANEDIFLKFYKESLSRVLESRTILIDRKFSKRK